MKPIKPAREKKTTDRYTVTEVGTILENINNQIKIVAEGHEGIDKRLERVETELHGTSRRLDMVELSSSVIMGKVTHLEDALSRFSKELKIEIAEVKTELKSEIRELGDRLASVESRR